MPGVVWYACNLSTPEVCTFEPSLGNLARPCIKTTGLGDVAQCKDSGSIPSTGGGGEGIQDVCPLPRPPSSLFVLTLTCPPNCAPRECLASTGPSLLEAGLSPTDPWYLFLLRHFPWSLTHLRGLGPLLKASGKQGWCPSFPCRHTGHQRTQWLTAKWMNDKGRWKETQAGSGPASLDSGPQKVRVGCR